MLIKQCVKRSISVVAALFAALLLSACSSNDFPPVSADQRNEEVDYEAMETLPELWNFNPMDNKKQGKHSLTRDLNSNDRECIPKNRESDSEDQTEQGNVLSNRELDPQNREEVPVLRENTSGIGEEKGAVWNNSEDNGRISRTVEVFIKGGQGNWIITRLLVSIDRVLVLRSAYPIAKIPQPRYCAY